MQLTVSAPATSANLGPGFDVLGLAVPFYNRLTFEAASALEIVNTGPEAAGLPTDASHLAYRSAVRVCTALGQPVPSWKLTMEVNIPQSRGLGSSSAAIVAGMAGANAWLGAPLSVEALLQLATEMEGHPDNVAPALYGGVTAAFTGEDGITQCLSLASAPPTALVVAVPAFELSTTEARRALPERYSRQDVVANLAAVTILTTVMSGGRIEWLRHALRDRIHQPYRLALIPGAESVREAAVEAGAWGVVISGAGPSLLAFCPADRQAAVQDAMTEAWRNHDISSRTLVFDRLSAGVQIEL